MFYINTLARSPSYKINLSMYIAHVGQGIDERLKKRRGGLARGEYLEVSDTTYLNTHSSNHWKGMEKGGGDSGPI